MDSSLAKGFKRQAFQQLENELDTIISNWIKVSKASKVTKNISHWNRYLEKLSSVFKKNLILKQLGGTTRKPYVALSVLTAGERNYNQWQEKCFSSSQILINFDPWYLEVLPAGFNLSEHTIHRIFQRVFDNSNNYNLKDIGLREVVNELIFCPLWSSYWMQEAIKRFHFSDAEFIKPVIPTPSGLLLGEINRNHTGKVEIRTFVSDNLLSTRQAELKRQMLEVDSIFKESSLNFFPILSPLDFKSIETESLRMSKAVTFADELLSSSFP